jgi:uncharacterized protein
MVKSKSSIILISFILFCFIPLSSAVEYPTPTGYVNDFASMLSPSDIARLNNEITAIETNTTVEIAIVTVDSLQGVSVEEYAVKLFEKWGIGQKEKDKGLLILVSKNDREYRIETGYGLEGTINAARAGRIGREILEPNFKNGEYGKGLYEAVLEVKALVSNPPDVGQPPPPPPQPILNNPYEVATSTEEHTDSQDFVGIYAGVMMVLMLILVIWLASFLYRAFQDGDESGKNRGGSIGGFGHWSGGGGWGGGGGSFGGGFGGFGGGHSGGGGFSGKW